jgi:hypothetical protein
MSAADYRDDGKVDLPIDTCAKLDRWESALNRTSKIDKRSTFKAAADDIYMQNQADLGTAQAIEDAIYYLGRDFAGLDHEDIDFIIVGAKASFTVETNASRIAAATAPPRQTSAPKQEMPASPIATRALLSKAQFLSGFVPPDYLIDGVLQRRFLYAVTASTGHGKTALALLVGEAVAARDHRTAFLGSHAVDKAT